MTAVSGIRLKSDIGGYTLGEYSLPSIDREPEKSLWASQVMNHKRAIDVNEVLVHKEDNMESIMDRQLDCISKVPYGINKGCEIGFSSLMNTSLLPHNWSSVQAQNPYKAFVDGRFLPITRSSIEVNRPLNHQPNRHILAEGKVNRDIAIPQGILSNPLKLKSLTEPEGVAAAIALLSETPKCQPEIKDRETTEIPIGSNPVANVSSDITVPFSPDLILRETEPVTISANPSMAKEMVNMLEVVDMREGSSYKIRDTLPKILGQRFQVKVYNPDTKEYISVHEKDSAKIMALAKIGKGINLSLGDNTDSKVIKLKDYRMTAFLAPQKVPVLVIEPWDIKVHTKEYRVAGGTSSVSGLKQAGPSQNVYKYRTPLYVPVISVSSSMKQTGESKIEKRERRQPTDVGEYFDRVPIINSNTVRPNLVRNKNERKVRIDKVDSYL
jgi:hypothetical protein